MGIDEALRGVETLERVSSSGDVTGVQYDSRHVRPGDMFVAMRGGSTDGNGFIAASIKRGAAAIVTDSREAWETGRSSGKPFYLVASGRRALAGVAANVLEHPERKLKVSAVTGTNGKTTTAWLLEQMLRSVGRKCVLVGTIETHVGDGVRPSEHTTPEASDLLQIFADGVRVGATEAVMEMSSHALDQERVWGVPVDVGIFTNLTQDHLDYHGTMEAYAAAKEKMFRGVGAGSPRVAVLNADDAFGARLCASNLASNVMSYGIDAGEYRAERIRLEGSRTSFDWRTPLGTVHMETKLTGRVNVYNVMACSCAALARGLVLAEVVEEAHHLDHVPGRFQVVDGSYEAGFTVVVDYAHTDDALRKLISLARELVQPLGGRVITVFGCGGDRDKGKRPKMGRVAAEGSDLVVVTSDNPRSEQPRDIIAEVLVGIRDTDAKYIQEEDRAIAIDLAIKAARPGDIVLIAGKGHEKAQIFRDRTIRFNDSEVAAHALLPVLREVKTQRARSKLVEREDIG